MRSIGRLDDQRQAATFVDYLLTQGIGAKAERAVSAGTPDAWELWIFNEDQRAAAKEKLAEFSAEPEADRFRAAAKEAERLRRAEAEREAEFRRKQRDLGRVGMSRRSRKRPITMSLLVISCLVFLISDGGTIRNEGSLIQKLSITDYWSMGSDRIQYYSELPEVRGGEWWRIVTPMFIHWSIVHIFFNMLWLIDLGTQVESQRGSVRMLLFTLLFAAGGNIVQFLVGGPSFGGMSGVVYGLFGYVWMKSVNEPESGLFVRPSAAVAMIVWFMIGVLNEFIPTMPMANYCHGVGLLLGIVCGYAPTLLGRFRKRI